METLATSETLAEDLPRATEQLGPKTGETTGESLDPPRIRERRDARTRVSRLGSYLESPAAKARDRRSARVSGGLIMEPAAETLGRRKMELVGEKRLGLPTNGDIAGGENLFAVGDLVWGKIKSHPWWPGQVHDPAQTSEQTTKPRSKDQCILVAFFSDNTFAWCQPSQLKPFKEEFKQMVNQSRSKGFLSAVKHALDEISQCLELSMTCYCVPVEDRARVGQVSFANYSPEEFLQHLRDAACDVSLSDLLEATMLRSWVSTFIGGKDGSSSIHGIIMDLVDQDANLNSPLRNFIKGKLEVEAVAGTTVAKGPDISGELSPRKKKRSMAELIAMDQGTMQPTSATEEKTLSARKRKKRESIKGSGVEFVAEEGSGWGRRERKRSKYLSPPYTYLSGFTKQRSDLAKDDEFEMPKKDIEASQALITDTQSLAKSSHDVEQKDEDEKSSSSFKYDGTSANEILLQFLSAAIDPLHVKWNCCSPKMVRDFFAKFRSLVYSSGSEFEAYQKQLAESKEGKSKSTGKRKKWKDGSSGEAALSLGHDTTTRRERRMGKNGVAIGGTPLNLNLDTAVGSEGKSVRKSKKRKDDTNGRTGVDSDHNLINSSAEGKLNQKRNKKGKGEANGDGTPVGSEKPKRKKSKDESTTYRPGYLSGNVATPLPYIRNSLQRMISTLTRSSLPEKDRASSEVLKPEVRENLVGDMKDLLNKVNSILTGPPGTST